jgi:ribosome biogenesis protein ENP2
MKCERVTDAENIDFAILSDDWTKTLHLQADRSISVHTASSVFYSTRIPTHGRSLAYHFPTCDALIGATGNQVYRLNLDQGRYLNPFELSSTVAGVNAVDVNPAHGLVACGTEGDETAGTVEFWDPRSRTRAGILNLPIEQLTGATSFSGSAFSEPVSVTSLASRIDGLNIAVGTSTGHTLLYDLRSSNPFTVKDQGYGLPVKSIEWCYSGGADSMNDMNEGSLGLLATVDSKVLKVWGSQSGQNLISINPPNDINDLCVYPNSGLVMLANEASPVTAYYIPQLGNAPKWCRFLDGMTEELEADTVETVYQDYKFIDRQELRTCVLLLLILGLVIALLNQKLTYFL